MLNIDLTGKRALVAGVADDAGFGFAIAKALAEAGASVSVGTWPPALNIFLNLLERGKMDEARRMTSGKLLEFEKIYPLDAVYDTLEAIRTTCARTSATRTWATVRSGAWRSGLPPTLASGRWTSSCTRSPTARR
jgi:enoyl-[acyl-carrier-protein] reductase (NADH)